MATGAKILVLGEANGQLRSAFKKLSAMHTKAPNLNFAIVVGDLFAAEDDEEVEDLLAGRITVPLRTYFTVGTNSLPKSVVERLSKDEIICENLYYLTKRSTTKTSEGIKIVTLGGKLDASIDGLSQEDFLPFHTTGDAKALKGTNTADILLTSQWPSLIREGSKSVIPSIAVDPEGDSSIAELCAAIRPRYHFSTSNTFFEREPFFHLPTGEAPEIKPVTRFVSLAPHGNSPKQKSIYAFQLSTIPATSIPLGCTSSPFWSLNRKKRTQNFDQTAYSRFGAQDGGYHRDKRQYSRPDDLDKCFFCIAAPEFKGHLVTAIGEDSFLALPKGPLTTSTTNSASGLPFPAHILLCPILHAPTLSTATDTETGQNRSEETYAEMTRFRNSLNAMVSARCKGALGTVTYEISRSRNRHDHWQFLPINQNFTAPQSSTGKSLLEAGFLVEAENMSYPAFKSRDPGVGRDEGDFFRVWIWTPPTEDQSEGTEKCLTMSLDSDKRFDLQFGRRVLAKLLNLENRTNWRDCEQSEEEEKADAAAFREAFKEFEFS